MSYSTTTDFMLANHCEVFEAIHLVRWTGVPAGNLIERRSQLRDSCLPHGCGMDICSLQLLSCKAMSMKESMFGSQATSDLV